jgi:hypothetical protein
MSFVDNDSTPNQGLSATSQATRELGGSRKFLEKRDASRLSQKVKQLTLWESPQNPVPEAGLFRQKPQIVSTPGVCPKERCRYRVVLGAEVLGDQLNLDAALKLAKGGTHNG